MEINKEKGQGVVEYILLLTVAISLVLTFYKSDIFQRMFGNQGQVGLAIKTQTEFGYRHSFLDPLGVSDPPYASAIQHPSYYNSSRGETRFFGPSDPYP